MGFAFPDSTTVNEGTPQSEDHNQEWHNRESENDVWSVLVVDDDQSVHDVTRLILNHCSISGKNIQLDHAYSAEEAKRFLEQENNFCVILLDVVMENDHAGLDLVNYIRKDLKNQMVRIVLRTGQPGQAPELSVISDYDINDYREKSELTSQKLKACMTSAIRSWQDLHTIHTLAEERANLELKSIAQNAQLQHINKQLQSEIQERSIAEAELELTNQKLSSIINNSSAIISLKDTQGNYDLVNDAFNHNLLLKEDYCIGKTDTDMFTPETCDMIRYHDQQVIKKSEGIQCEEILPTPDGDHFYLSIKFPLFNKSGELYRICTISTDITERLEAQHKILHYSQYDSLTDLPNRTLFIDRLSQAISRTPWNQHFIAVVFIDLDRFKIINDTLGHDVGDELLKQVARRLKDSVRKGDTVSRLGGDEFAIILTELASDKDITRVVEKISQVAAAPYYIDGKELIVTPSIGISRCPLDGKEVQVLLKKADVAMYKAKKAGRNLIRFYSSEDDAKAIEQLNMEIELRKMVEDKDAHLALVYQPKVNISDGRIEGVEALLRWNHPERGMISPGIFIPLLEETGLIENVGEWVLKQACTFATKCHANGNPLKVAINLSTRQFISRRLVNQLYEILEDTQCQPQWIELEVTEGALIDDIDNSREILSEISSMGITLAIDDFGTGYSSMNYLKQLPFNTLKIDRCFIVDAPQASQDKAIVTTIAQLAHNLNMSVVAEGVETEEQYQLLTQVINPKENNQIQGFIFSKPVNDEQIINLQTSVSKKWTQVNNDSSQQHSR